MIRVTRFNGADVVINAELVETVEATPDTIITLTTERKIIVKEGLEEVIQKIVDYKKAIWSHVTVIDRKSKVE